MYLEVGSRQSAVGSRQPRPPGTDGRGVATEPSPGEHVRVATQQSTRPQTFHELGKLLALHHLATPARIACVRAELHRVDGVHLRAPVRTPSAWWDGFREGASGCESGGRTSNPSSCRGKTADLLPT